MKNMTVKLASIMVLSLSANPANAANLIFNGDFSAGLNGWKNVEFTGVMRWLAEHLEAYRRDEEDGGEGVYFVG